jgi:DNA-binding phage protein
MLQDYEFDVAQYLPDPAAIEAYLQPALEGGDPAEIEEARAVAARARARLAQRETPAP